MKYRKYPLNHSRVETYKVTHNPRYNNFLIGKDLIYENELMFVYEKNGEKVEKIIPMTAIGQYFKKKLFFHKDEFLLKREFKGAAYSVDADIIFNY